jgi:O-acetyl-ADP-ribose deacetylase (regulator of RNase III)
VHGRLHFSRVITVVRADITTLKVDAIVNAANEALRGGGGVDGAIHRAAGPQLLEDLLQYPSCRTGGAVLTRGYRLPAKYVIHAVGPVWRGGGAGEAALLESAYESSFARAREVGDVRTIAFSAISTGVYGFPKPLASRTALAVMQRHEPEFDEIVACVFDDEAAKLYEQNLANLGAKPSTRLA